MRKSLLLSAVILFCLTAFAGPVDRETALARAKKFYADKGISIDQQRPAFKAPRAGSAEEKAYYYVFNAGNDKGFVVVSGDDRTPEILGYTDSGTFIEDEMPDNMRSWFNHYADEIKFLDDNNIQRTAESKATTLRKASKVHHSIAPMLTCLWDQGNPYNVSCPVYYDGNNNTQTSMTGCVATALAQLLYYHKYPQATKMRIPGYSKKFTLTDGTVKYVTLRPIDAGTKIDWDNMLDRYNGSETEVQKKAVGDLMLIAGQAVRMDYGASSGSSYANSRKLFVDYLGFDDGVQILRSDKYGIQEWFEMMYDELAAGYPIAYGGSSTGGGHAFVIDGYDGGDLFHLNWGWSGGSNGYFLISVLNPGDQGIGGSTSADGFSMAQDAIMYLRAEDDGIAYNPESDTHMAINDTKVTGTNVFSNYINWSGSTNSFNGAIVMEDAAGTLVPVSDVQTANNLSANYYLGWTFNLNGRFDKPGTYRVTPASKLTANPTWRPLYDLRGDYILAEVDQDLNVTLSTVYAGNGLSIAEWAFPGTLTKGDQQDVTVKFQNDGSEFLKEVSLFASKTSDKGSAVSNALVGVKAGESNIITFFFKPAEAGEYNIWITRRDNPNIVIGKTTVTVNETNVKKYNLRFSTMSVSNKAIGGRAIGSVTVQNIGTTDFDGRIKLQLWKKDQSSGTYWSSSSTTVDVKVLSTKSALAYFDFQNLEMNREYALVAYYTNQPGELDNSGLKAEHSFTTQRGLNYWNAFGQVQGALPAATYTMMSASSGVLIDGNFGTIVPSKNTNAIYCVTDNAKMPAGLDGCNVAVSGKADNICLVSNLAYTVPSSFTAAKAEYSHTFTTACDGSKGFSVVTLPFAPSGITIDGVEVTPNAPGGFIMREFAGEDDDSKAVFDDVSTLRENTPYIIGAPEALVGKTVVFTGDNVSFVASDLNSMVLSTEHYVMHGATVTPRVTDCYVLNADGSAFDYVSSSVKATAKGAYFTTKLSEELRPASIVIGSTADAIRDVAPAADSDDKVYDLQGRRVNRDSLGKGIYIINGRKITN